MDYVVTMTLVGDTASDVFSDLTAHVVDNDLLASTEEGKNTWLEIFEEDHVGCRFVGTTHADRLGIWADFFEELTRDEPGLSVVYIVQDHTPGAHLARVQMFEDGANTFHSRAAMLAAA